MVPWGWPQHPNASPGKEAGKIIWLGMGAGPVAKARRLESAAGEVPRSRPPLSRPIKKRLRLRRWMLPYLKNGFDEAAVVTRSRGKDGSRSDVVARQPPCRSAGGTRPARPGKVYTFCSVKPRALPTTSAAPTVWEGPVPVSRLFQLFRHFHFLLAPSRCFCKNKGNPPRARLLPPTR